MFLKHKTSKHDQERKGNKNAYKLSVKYFMVYENVRADNPRVFK